LKTSVTVHGVVRALCGGRCRHQEIGSGRVRAQMEEVYDGVAVSDSLREALANPDSVNADLYTTEERRELIYQVLRCIAIGGSMMQWEDELGPYLDAARTWYKDLVTVVRGPAGGVEVVSKAYQVTALEGEGLTPQLFPSASPNHVCWVIIDPVKAQVTLL